MAYNYGFPPLEKLDRFPELKQVFDNMVELQMQIDNSGYDNMTSEEYKTWLMSAQKEQIRN